MGRNSNKCRRVLPEVAEAEFPALRTRSKTKEEETSLETAEKRSREVADGQLDFASNSELRSGARRRVMIEEAKKSVSPADGVDSCGALTAVVEVNSASEAASCCSSDASIQLVAERSAIVDPTLIPSITQGQTELETLTFSGGRYNRSEATPASSTSGDMESAIAARPLGETNSRFKSEIPSKSEIDDFFASAEKDLHKRFSEKYNFDVEKGVPMNNGRYEWVPVKP